MFAFIRKLILGSPAYRFDFAAARRRCNILLIDNEANALPLADIMRGDYHISQQTSETPDLPRQCEAGHFDIIILDYAGVASKTITPDDGFGVFSRIRSSNPEQYIIAISGHTYDVSMTRYSKDANDWLRKPTDLATASEKIDLGIRHLFDKSEVLNRFRRQLLDDGITARRAQKLIEEFTTHNYENLDETLEAVRRIAKISEISEKAVGIARNITKLASL